MEGKVIEDDNARAKIATPSSPAASAKDVSPQPEIAMTWRQRAQRLQKKAHVFYFVSKHRDTPWYAKLVAACTAGYLFSPVQIIPNYIPVIGMLDDVLVVFLGVKLIQRITPAYVMAECQRLADDAEVRRREKIRSKAAVIVSFVVAAVWLLVGIAASVFMARYFRR